MSQLIQETAKFWCDRELGNLELIKAKYITHNFSRHTHEGYAIALGGRLVNWRSPTKNTARQPSLATAAKLSV